MQIIVDCWNGGVMDEAGRGRGLARQSRPFQLNWGGKLGVLAPSKMVLGLRRGGKSPLEMETARLVQLHWGGKLGLLAPSEMVMGLRRGANSPSEMVARQPG